ncbi:DUF2339 domain-containing protein [Arenimonas composti]|uniref:DUF2339 domain-containing protein n=1 Tax=Arenimonas composti TR7-09 = DSM 18010 TaxID=1121013 RepID=A0A091B9R0_9GAMM|nr:DUF2339 domain-containing protein [Arenimonas composti]KFN49388.1 hypothetical protein P873_01065 [Arenimonas composti TR7-09 = DSM 18010]
MEALVFILVVVLLAAVGFVIYTLVLGMRMRALSRQLAHAETALRAALGRLTAVETVLQRMQAPPAAPGTPAEAASAPAAVPEPVPASPPADAAPAQRPPSPAPASSPGIAPSTPAPIQTPPQPAGPASPQPLPTPARVAPPPMRRAAPEPDILEKLVATVRGWLFEGNVPVKIGLLVIMFGVAAALKYAADAGWLRLPIEFRLAGIAAGAIAGLVWGLKNVRERPVFGLSLQGGAIGVLLLTVFAAFRLYHVLPALPAFALVVALVAGASVLAVRQNAVALAVLGFIGGYLAPVLISTGSGNHVALFSYYALLNAAVFGIAWARPWRALNLIGFLFTFAIGGLWGAKYYRPELFATVEPFLVLFFLFYVGIPVLYALRGKGRNAPVDGSLLFGTPLLAFPAQVGLLEGDRMGLAASAVVVAAIYTGLALWARREPRLRTLAQSSAALGVVFVTLAVPLALTARWTSSAWALQGLGMVWLGLRQQRWLTRWSGLALLVLACGALGVAIIDSAGSFDAAGPFVLNGWAMNLLVLALAWLGTALVHDRAGRDAPVAVIAYLVGLAWWAAFGIREIELNLPDVQMETALGVFAAVSAVLAALLRRPLQWPRLGWTTGMASVLALPLAIAALDQHLPAVAPDAWPLAATWFDAPLAAWWAVVAALLLSLRALRDPGSAWLPAAHIGVLLSFAFGAGASLWRLAAERLGLGDGWWPPAGVAPLLALFLLAWRRPALAAWPLDVDDFARWRRTWLGIAGVLLGLVWLSAQFRPGLATPLRFLPVANPLELMLIGGLVLAAARLRDGRGSTALWPFWSLAAFLTLTMMVLRSCHHFAALPWSPSILSSGTTQTALTVAWCIAGVTAWILGSLRRNRALWWAGALLLGVVLAKLLLIDRSHLGNLTGIVSFLAVGMLLVVVGRIAPTPPRQE